MTQHGIETIVYVLIGWSITQVSILISYWVYFKIDDIKFKRENNLKQR